MSSDCIPCIDTYRGIGVHDRQPAERIERVVKPEIDQVLDRLHDIGDLLTFARDARHAPEARMLAAAKIEAQFTLAVDERRSRPPGITLELVHAVIAGLDSVRWRSKHYYASLLDCGPRPGEKWPRRDVPIED